MHAISLGQGLVHCALQDNTMHKTSEIMSVNVNILYRYRYIYRYMFQNKYMCKHNVVLLFAFIDVSISL